MPISDPEKLRAIRTEAEILTAANPTAPSETWVEVPANRWPPTIASLRPESVTVTRWGLDIMIRGYFDGGWGYHVPRDSRNLPMPSECYWRMSDGVFWHGPC
jgi:hypothetical protein